MTSLDGFRIGERIVCVDPQCRSTRTTTPPLVRWKVYTVRECLDRVLIRLEGVTCQDGPVEGWFGVSRFRKLEPGEGNTTPPQPEPSLPW